MIVSSNLGLPRIGPNRELKKALEGYWAGKTDEPALQDACRALRRQAWQWQREAGIAHIPSNDFSMYDHVLDTSVLVGAVPPRFDWDGSSVSLPTYFAMARGDADRALAALAMTKWFDTNYHYLVPEFQPGQTFRLCSTRPIDEFVEARAIGVPTRPVLLGPVSYLLLGRSSANESSNLPLLNGLLPVYEELFSRLADAGAEWIQIDEPCLATDLDPTAQAALGRAYERLGRVSPKLAILVASYFGPLGDNLKTAVALPVRALHVDLVRGEAQLAAVLEALPPTMGLSVGLIDGRNVWKTDLQKASGLLRRVVDAIGSERTMVGPSCSLLHVPVDLGPETGLDATVRSWLAFARQKLTEIVTLARSVDGSESGAAMAQNALAVRSRRESPLTHDADVRRRSAAVTPEMAHRQSPYERRREVQRKGLALPLYPTTTIGSFPQTPEIRKARASFKRGELTQAQYDAFLRDTLAETIRFQEEVGLDVLVHGEAERTDMVEYFGEQLRGFAFTRNGWVQSYGSRCVKPPILYGDVARRGPMTVRWAREAMVCTRKPVKGMLTGPITILCWSFVRDDQPRAETCRQIALAIRDEVHDLEAAGVRIIQIDEPAIREGLPLREADRPEYLRWAVECFRLASTGVADATQIHTHMCYSEFRHILEAVVALDADVLSIETARGAMELLAAFRECRYPNEIGPGVYDIHSPQIPSTESMQRLLEKATEVLRPEQLWVNPDCGLKTRTWDEVRPSLENMVAAARAMRAQAAR